MRKNKFGQRIIHLETVDSTNDYLLGLASKGATHGTVVIADAQKKGRGRLERSWHSPPGKNIYMSVLLKPDFQPEDFPLLTVMTAVACASAIKSVTGIEAKLKWPNDIVVSGRKLGGILIESRIRAGGIAYAVVGIGINVNSRREDFPEDLRGIATSIFQKVGRSTKRTLLIDRILRELETEVDIVDEENRYRLIERYKEISDTIGNRVVVHEGKRRFDGNAIDVDKQGHLLVKTDGGDVKRVISGDVAVIRKL